MKQLTQKILIAAIIAALLSLFGNITTRTRATSENSESTADSVFVSAPVLEKRVIYQCRLGTEEIPAVRIWEARTPNGQVAETIAHVDFKSEIEVTTTNAAPTWDYKSISAHSADGAIDVEFKPNGARRGFDWILTLEDSNTNFRKRVRDCMEVADE